MAAPPVMPFARPAGGVPPAHAGLAAMSSDDHPRQGGDAGMPILEFARATFLAGRNTTVRRGTRWHGVPAARLRLADGGLSPPVALETVLRVFRELDEADLRFEHDPACRTPTGLSAARMVHVGEVSELPDAELGHALEAMTRPRDPTPRLRVYNTVGHLSDQVGSAAAYGRYIARAADLEGVRRAALLAATLREEGVPRGDVAAAVRAAPLRQPHDDAAFEWDVAGSTIVFPGLEAGHRGRQALLLQPAVNADRGS